MPEFFTLIALDGDWRRFEEDVGMPSLRFEGLTWEEAVELATLSLRHGLQIVMMRERGAEHG